MPSGRSGGATKLRCFADLGAGEAGQVILKGRKAINWKVDCSRLFLREGSARRCGGNDRGLFPSFEDQASIASADTKTAGARGDD